MGFFDRIREGLSKTTQQIVERFDEIVSQSEAPARKGRPIDVDTIEALEELLIWRVGVAATDAYAAVRRKRRPPRAARRGQRRDTRNLRPRRGPACRPTIISLTSY